MLISSMQCIETQEMTQTSTNNQERTAYTQEDVHRRERLGSLAGLSEISSDFLDQIDPSLFANISNEEIAQLVYEIENGINETPNGRRNSVESVIRRLSCQWVDQVTSGNDDASVSSSYTNKAKALRRLSSILLSGFDTQNTTTNHLSESSTSEKIFNPMNSTPRGLTDGNISSNRVIDDFNPSHCDNPPSNATSINRGSSLEKKRLSSFSQMAATVEQGHSGKSRRVSRCNSIMNSGQPPCAPYQRNSSLDMLASTMLSECFQGNINPSNFENNAYDSSRNSSHRTHEQVSAGMPPPMANIASQNFSDLFSSARSALSTFQTNYLTGEGALNIARMNPHMLLQHQPTISFSALSESMSKSRQTRKMIEDWDNIMGANPNQSQSVRKSIRTREMLQQLMNNGSSSIVPGAANCA